MSRRKNPDLLAQFALGVEAVEAVDGDLPAPSRAIDPATASPVAHTGGNRLQRAQPPPSLINPGTDPMDYDGMDLRPPGLAAESTTPSKPGPKRNTRWQKDLELDFLQAPPHDQASPDASTAKGELGERIGQDVDATTQGLPQQGGDEFSAAIAALRSLAEKEERKPDFGSSSPMKPAPQISLDLSDIGTADVTVPFVEPPVAPPEHPIVKNERHSDQPDEHLPGRLSEELSVGRAEPRRHTVLDSSDEEDGGEELVASILDCNAGPGLKPGLGHHRRALPRAWSLDTLAIESTPPTEPIDNAALVSPSRTTAASRVIQVTPSRKDREQARNPPEAPPPSEEEVAMRRRIAAVVFNRRPVAGIRYMLKHELVRSDAEELAVFLTDLEGISRATLLAFLGSPAELSARVGRAVMDLVQAGASSFLTSVQGLVQLLPCSEGPDGEPVLTLFAQSYAHRHPSQFRKWADVLVAVKAILTLSEQLHGSAGPATTRAEFIRRHEGSAGMFTPIFLGDAFAFVQRNPLRTQPDHVDELSRVAQCITRYPDGSPLVARHRRYEDRCVVTHVLNPAVPTPKHKRRRVLLVFSDRVVLAKLKQRQLVFKEECLLTGLCARPLATGLYPHALALYPRVHGGDGPHGHRDDEAEPALVVNAGTAADQTALVVLLNALAEEYAASLAALQSDGDSLAALAGRGRLELFIPDLATQGQLDAIEHHVNHLPGVLSAEVTCADRKGRFKYDPEAVNHGQITESLRGLGVRCTLWSERESYVPTAQSLDGAEPEGDPGALDSDEYESDAGQDGAHGTASGADLHGGDKPVIPTKPATSIEAELAALQQKMALLTSLKEQQDREQEQRDSANRLVEGRRRLYQRRELRKQQGEAGGGATDAGLGRGSPAFGPRYFTAESELMDAANKGDSNAIVELLADGVYVNEVDSSGRSALMHAVHNGHLDCVKLLMDYGSEVNHRALDGSTALHEAAYHGSKATVRLLVQYGANALACDNGGRQPLHWSTGNPSTQPLVFFATRVSGGNVNAMASDGMTPAMYAAYHNRPGHLRKLLTLGADLEEKDVDGKTAMHWAVHASDAQCLQAVLDLPSTFFRDGEGRTVMHRAAERGGAASVEHILAVRHDSVDDLDRLGRTPIFWAAACNNPAALVRLLGAGADPLHCDNTGATARDYAEALGMYRCITLLKEAVGEQTQDAALPSLRASPQRQQHPGVLRVAPAALAS